MTTTEAVRASAILAAVIGAIDPDWTVVRRAPVRVELQTSSRPQAVAAAADAVQARLARALGDTIAFDSQDDPAAVVTVGDRLPPEALEDGRPVSVVMLASPSAPNVRVTALDPPSAPAGAMAQVTATVTGKRMNGTTSRIALEHHGLELGKIEHRWTRDEERFEGEFILPASASARHLSIVATPLDREVTAADNRTDVRLLASKRPLEVLTFEPRASWTCTFVRRALESDRRFGVAAFVRTSRGVHVRANDPPVRLTAAALDPYDAVLIGAPEELSEAELEALDAYARRRGGAVVFLPDRRPSGAYVRLLPTDAFEEVLLEEDVELTSDIGTLRASEIVVPRSLRPGVESIAQVPLGGTKTPVIVAWPSGAGRFVFSGALDAWRQREDGSQFARFWSTRIAALAAESPGPVEVTVTPALAAPGDPVRMRAMVRASLFDRTSRQLGIPLVSARVLGRDGAVTWVRLWPGAEPGVFEGTFRASVAGDYEAEARAIPGGSGRTLLLVREGAARGGAVEPELLEGVTLATGGTVATTTDLSPLEAQLQTLPRREREVALHPARSLWWTGAFTGLLCTEWMIRRRRGMP